MRPAKPITGRVETPEGRPAAGVRGAGVLAHRQGRGLVRVRLLRPGQDGRPGPVPAADHHARPGGVLGPAQGLCPRAVRGPRGEAGRHGDDHPEEGRLRGRPGPGCPGQADRRRVRRDRAAARERAGSAGARPVFVSSVDPPGRRRPTPTGDSPSPRCPRGNTRSSPARPTTMATGRSNGPSRPLPEVFAPTKLTIKEGETPAPLEIRALPSVVIEGHWVDSKGQPKGGWSSLVGGKIDGSSWIAQAHPDAQGRFSVKVPHGLEDASLTIMTNEHASTRHRIGKGGPLVEGRAVQARHARPRRQGYRDRPVRRADHRHQRHHEGRPADQGFQGGRRVHRPRPE